jgi:hypothetical protein
MSAQAKPIVAKDPAGLDELLLAAGKGITRYLEQIATAKLGKPIELWDGQDGLGQVLEEHLKAAGVPNKRLPELVTPRSIVNQFAPRKRVVKRLNK